MQKLKLPFIILPTEFLTLLKSNLFVTTSPAPIFDVIRPNKALYYTLEKTFKDFDDGRGLEKTMMALGWSNFRDRVASIYVYKAIHGEYPAQTSMDLVGDIKVLEQKYSQHGVHSYSRLFLLGFYMRLSMIQIQKREQNQYLDLVIPESMTAILKLSHGRSEKIDLLILVCMHLIEALGEKMLMNALMSGKKFENLYTLLEPDYKKRMSENLLAYAASIRETDLFLYDKI